MRSIKSAALFGLAAAAAACGQGGSGNVMSPEANALEPAQVNAMLGPENATAANALDSNSANGVGNEAGNGAAVNETASNNTAR